MAFTCKQFASQPAYILIYGYRVGGSLQMLGRYNLCDKASLRSFLLSCQTKVHSHVCHQECFLACSNFWFSSSNWAISFITRLSNIYNQVNIIQAYQQIFQQQFMMSTWTDINCIHSPRFESNSWTYWDLRSTIGSQIVNCNEMSLFAVWWLQQISTNIGPNWFSRSFTFLLQHLWL